MRSEKKNRKSLSRLKMQYPLHMIMIPGIILVIIFQYIPMYGNIMAFQRFIPGKGFWHSPLIGLENFKYLFTLPNFYQVLRNTLFIAIFKIVLGTVTSITLALLLNEARNALFKRTVQTIVYLPYFLSWVILGSIFISMLIDDGAINNLLISMGLVKEPVFFLGDDDWFRFIIITTDVWKNAGFGTIIYLAAITNIEPSLYQAAVVDGAGYFRQMYHITLPGMRPIIVLMVVISLGGLLNAGFEQIFVMYNNLVMDKSDIIDTLVYRLGLQNARYSLATAVGIFKAVISLVLISSSYYMAYRFADYRIF